LTTLMSSTSRVEPATWLQCTIANSTTIHDRGERTMKRLLQFCCLFGVAISAGSAFAQATEATIDSIVVAWQTPPVDSVALEGLLVRSVAARDARVLTAVQSAAQQTSSSRLVRIAALRAAFTFAVGRASGLPTVDELTADSLTPPSAETGILWQTGAQPVTTSNVSSLATAMTNLANDADLVVRAAAARVHVWAQVTAAPKPQLSYVCDRTFRIRNTSDLTTVVIYTVSGSQDSEQVTVAARSSPASYADTFFNANSYGTVTISSLSGTEIGSAGNSRLACPS
jgi:hypothetical protein